MAKIEELKSELDEFVSNGGNVDDLTRKDPLYIKIKDKTIRDNAGNVLSLEDKFAFLGHARKPKKAKSAIENIQKILNLSIEENRVLTAEERKYINGIKIKGEDGEYLSFEQKIVLAGGEYIPGRRSDLKQALIDEVESYCKAGGSFHKHRHELPFYETLISYKRSINCGLTPEQIMKDLGYKEYSDIYYRFAKLEEIFNYQDEQGNVDSYRQDKQMNNFVKGCVKSLNMPAGYVLSLVCDAKLGSYYIQDEYIGRLKTDFEKHITTYKTLENIDKINPSLYYKFAYLYRVLSSEYEEMTVEDLLQDVLGIELVGENGVDSIKQNIPVRKRKKLHMTKKALNEKLTQMSGDVTRWDFTNKEYRLIADLACANGTDIVGFLKTYNLNYQRSKYNPKFSKLMVHELPYIEEMKALRDETIAKAGISKENGNCKEEIFECKILACLESYVSIAKKYGMIDENFDDADIVFASNYDEKYEYISDKKGQPDTNSQEITPIDN